MNTDFFDSQIRNRIIDPVIRRTESNARARDCRRCGRDMPKGTGTQVRFWFSDRCIDSYLCADCVPIVSELAGGPSASLGEQR